MKNSKWNDTQLKELLQNMPHIQDNRSPQEIYQNISSMQIKKRKKSFIFPAFAAIAVIFVIAFYMPNYIHERNNEHQVADQEISTRSLDKNSEMAIMEKAIPSEDSKESIGLEDGEAFEMRYYNPIENEGITNRANKGYFIYKNYDQILLVPYSQPFATFDVALKNMKEQKSVILLPAIPKDIIITNIKAIGDKVTVTFSEFSQLTNSEEDLLMLHAIMLTAREFGYNYVTFISPNVDYVGELKMNTENKVPVSPNLLQAK